MCVCVNMCVYYMYKYERKTLLCYGQTTSTMIKKV